MIDTFTITIIFIFLSAFLAIMIRKLKRDKCLKDFHKDIITFESRKGEVLKGQMNVGNTGLEFLLNKPIVDNSIVLKSVLLYKAEYINIQALVRYIDDLSDKSLLEREKDLDRTFHPTKLRKSRRRVANFFRRIKDSLLEVFNIASKQVNQNSTLGLLVNSQDKYIDKVKKEFFGSIENSFEPLLEKYIGYRVVLELDKDGSVIKYNGILKDYTNEFIELIDLNYPQINDLSIKGRADLIVLRRYGVIRGLSLQKRTVNIDEQ
ncbi:hypothetical protein [Natronospora cellulosivora (SeqCode)]